MEPAASYLVKAAGTMADYPPPAFDAGLTDREREVLTMVCQALPDKAIARRLNVSAKTVSTHLEHIYLKLGVRGDVQNARCAAILFALERDLVSPPTHKGYANV